MANDTTAKTPAARKRTPAKKAPAAAKKAPASTKAKAPAKVTATPRLAPSPPEGWYADPADPQVLRYWDGDGWNDDLGTVRADETPAPASTTQQAAGGESGGDGGGADPGTITFRGRVMAVTRPSEDQMALWQRIATRAQTFQRESQTPKPCPDCQGTGALAEETCQACAGTGDANTRTALRLFNQTMNIITSVLVDEADKDWLEDELVGGAIDLVDASEILTLTVSALIASRRQAAPRTGPAPKARRRK